MNVQVVLQDGRQSLSAREAVRVGQVEAAHTHVHERGRADTHSRAGNTPVASMHAIDLSERSGVAGA